MNLSRVFLVIPHLLKKYLRGLATLFRQYAKVQSEFLRLKSQNQRKYRILNQYLNLLRVESTTDHQSRGALSSKSNQTKEKLSAVKNHCLQFRNSSSNSNYFSFFVFSNNLLKVLPSSRTTFSAISIKSKFSSLRAFEAI